MKKSFIAFLLCLALLLPCLMGHAEAPAESIDFAGQLRLNLYSETVKAEVTVKTFVDGDTTHFHISPDICETGVLKARYLAVNTPETTGKVEEYGKKAAAFTKEKLSQADSIIIESDDNRWNVDSTGGRHLVWVWYRPAGEKEYRCLNLELLQNGLCRANSTANNRYGSTCQSALNQAKAQKLNLYSGQKDPDFYYGEAVELTLKELRTNLETYNGVKVAFNGVISMNNSQTVYVEAYDAETGMYFGMPVYYGYGLSGAGLRILQLGNEVRIVGTLQYYEAGGTWQVSDLNYRMMKPQDPGNIQKLSEGHSAAYVLTDADTFANGQVTIETEDAALTFPYADLAMATSVQMKDLVVRQVYTTLNEDSSSFGAITMSCDAGGVPVTVRTVPMMENGALITEDRYLGKTIDVKGVVDYYDGGYQVKVLLPEHITIHE